MIVLKIRTFPIDLNNQANLKKVYYTIKSKSINQVTIVLKQKWHRNSCENMLNKNASQDYAKRPLQLLYGGVSAKLGCL